MKKLLALILCLSMVLGIVYCGAVVAAENSADIPFYTNYFDAETDLASDKVTQKPGNVKSTTIEEVEGCNGDGAVQLVFKQDLSDARVLDMKNVTFKKGYYYEVTFRAKTTVSGTPKVKLLGYFESDPMLDPAGVEVKYPNTVLSLTSEWKTYKYSLKITGFKSGKDEVVSAFWFQMSGKADDILYIDDFEIRECPLPTLPEGYIFKQDFNSAIEVGMDDMFHETAEKDGRGVHAIAEGGNGDASSFSYTFIKPTSETADGAGNTRLMEMRSVPFKKGNRYEITFSCKAEKEIAGATLTGKGLFSSAYIKLPDGSLSAYPSVTAPFGTDWTTKTFGFTVADFTDSKGVSKGIDEFKATVFFDLNNKFVKDDKIYVDNISIREYKVPVVKVNVTGDGSVKYNGNVIADGTVVTIPYYGANETIDIVCNDEAKSPRVYINGTKTTLTENKIDLSKLEGEIDLDVSFESPAVLFENHYDTAADINRGISNTTATRATYAFEPNGGNDGGAIKFTYQKTESGRLANLGSAPIKEGYRYDVSFKVRSSVKMTKGKFLFGGKAYISSDMNRSTYPINKSNQTFDTEWKTFTYSFTIDDYITNATNGAEIVSSTTDSATCSIMFEPGGYSAGDWVMFDDIVITRHKAPTVTVSAGEGGKVERFYNSGTSNGTAWENVRTAVTGDKFCFLEGKTAKFRITPDEGKKAIVKVDGHEVAVGTNGMVSFAVNADSDLDVTFTDANVPAGIENAKTTSWLRDVDGVPTIYVYTQLSAFTSGESYNFGIKLWNKANPSAVAVLHARDDSDTLSVATPGKTFAIKAYGDAITAEDSYEAVPFIGETEGSVQELKFN